MKSRITIFLLYFLNKIFKEKIENNNGVNCIDLNVLDWSGRLKLYVYELGILKYCRKSFDKLYILFKVYYLLSMLEENENFPISNNLLCFFLQLRIKCLAPY